MNLAIFRSATLRSPDSAPLEPPARPGPVERALQALTSARPGEGRSVALFATYAFVLLLCYYVLKTIREPLLLQGGAAEQKSYACAAIAAVLLVVVPLYSALFRRTERLQLVRAITALFVTNLGVFYILGRAGVDIGFVYYVWVGVFGVTMLAQFWAHAARAYKVESGQRLFPAIMAGAALGGLIGPLLSSALFARIGPWTLMLLAMTLLAATVPLVERTARAVPASSRNAAERAVPSGTASGGFALVLRDRYLLLLAALAVLSNCVNTAGEYILAEIVLRDVEGRLLAQPGLDKSGLIAAFYGNYYFAVNTLSLLVQMLLVVRIFRWIGVRSAILILPVIALIGYGLVAFLPIFGIIRAVKVLENSTDYSIANTIRHVLYLPLPAAHKFEGKTAIDTFFWRLGDFVQAAVIYVGLHWLGFELQEFALLNMALVLVWIAVALKIGDRYSHDAPPRARANWRALTIGACSAAFALEVRFDAQALCRDGETSECADTPALLVYRDADGSERHIRARLRVRGKWRAETGNCTVPPLFVFFDAETTAGSPFAAERMLPLTTHCRNQSAYEQYVLKEYLAYRIYNLLTTKSLRVRLARIAYRDAGRREQRDVDARYAFFTEHFDSLAARHGAARIEADDFRPLEADADELAAFELFQYLIGNTAWSATRGHNVTHVRAAAGLVTAVPYDFDFSGLVDAGYAGPSPKLPIDRVTQRLFRGFCRADHDWQRTVARFTSLRGAIAALVDAVPGLAPRERGEAHDYLERFFAIVNSPPQFQAQIVAACRAAI